MSNWYRDIADRLKNAILSESIHEIENGYMKHARDINGLQAYLRELQVIPRDGVILPMQQFEEELDDPEFASSPIYGYYVNLDERGDFYADVRDRQGKSVYEVKNQEDDFDEEPVEDFDDGEHDGFEEGIHEDSSSKVYHVVLIAKDIQVQAANETEAYSFAREDAREFSGQWNYDVQKSELMPQVTGIHRDMDMLDIDVVRVSKSKNPWTFNGVFTMYAMGTSPEDAAKNAIENMRSK